MSSGSAVLDASSPRASAWVSANAGSGKTYVLTARVIRLLLDGTPPGRLLCLTYTRAAAAEMRARVFERLGGWALMDQAKLVADITALDGETPDDVRLSRARQLFATALETPGGLKIQTIHAFCEKLVGRFPVEADAPVPFQVLTDIDAAEMKAEARMEALERLGAEGRDALMNALAPVLNGEGFAALFEGRSAGLIAKYGDGDPWAAAGLPAGTTPDDVIAAAGYDEPGRVAFFRAAAAVLLGGGKTDKAIGEDLARGLATDDAEARFMAITGAFLTQKGFLRASIGTKALRNAHGQMFADLDIEAQQAVENLQRLASAESAEMANAIATLGRGVAAIYRAAKRDRGVLDFDDLIRAALHLLRSSEAAAWALYKLDGGLDHILIDEAQDTSPDQWAVVRQLAQEFFAGSGARADLKGKQRTLFAVGDEKQSIFSFQGADPAEFARVRTEFRAAAQGAEALFHVSTLNTSRRSVPAVLGLADAVFADPDLRRAVSGGDWAGHIAHRASGAGSVEIWPLAEAEDADGGDDWLKPVDAPPPDDPSARLAGVIAQTIKGWIASGQTVEDKAGTPRPMQASDVLILVRSRGRLSRAIIRRLKQEGVAVAGADRLALLDHIAVKDLIAYGRAALLPQDDLNLAALLRSPFFDISEDELFALGHGREGQSLWARLAAVAAGDVAIALPQARAAEVIEALRAAANRLGRDAPFDFYARLLAAGGRRALLARLGDEAEDVIDEFLAAAAAHEETHAPSLEGFLHVLEAAGGEVKRDPDAAGSAVRVLTTHGAKGLEAPVVILPDTMSLPHHSNVPNLLHHEGALVWLPSGAPEALAAKEAYQAAEHDEHKRLLYVALTRPRDRLIVCGVQPGRASKTGVTWYQAVKAGFERLEGCETIETPLGPGMRFGGLPPAMPGAAAVVRREQELPAWATARAAHEEPLGVVRPSQLAPALVFGDTAVAFGLERGRIIHRLLQSLPGVAAERRAEAGARFLEARAGMIDAVERAAILERVMTVLTEGRFAAAFAPGSRAEAPIAGRVKALGARGFISGQIDRLAVSSTDVLIVDYKTNRRVPERVEATPQPYLAQMALYREAMKAAFPGRSVRAALLWTEAPEIMELPDSLLDAALARLSGA
jgi:ATP-dependent helicase/nuclease subunit A